MTKEETPVVEVEKKSPQAWAVEKGLLVLLPTGQVNYKKLVPWVWNEMVAKAGATWPNPNLDPTFVITEEAFNKVHDLAK